MNQLSGPLGAVTLNNGTVSFVATPGATGTVPFSYQIKDQLGDVSPTIYDAIAIDPGVSVAATTSGGS